MSAKLPEVRIYFSWLLYDTVSTPLNKFWDKDGTQPLASPKTCRQYADNYRKEWAKYEDKILPALTDALGVEFYKSIIDVPCTPWVRAISDPLTLNFLHYPDQFVDDLTHELCHVLLTDNAVYSIKSTEKEFDLRDRWSKLFGGKTHDFVEVVHIPVHALCKYIYLDVLQDPSRLERDVMHVKDNPPYAAAWEYVNSHDYHAILEQLSGDYRALAKELA